MRLLKIGRDSSCDIVLNSNRVSSLHAEMTLLANGDILVEDKGSSNGTLLSGRPLAAGKAVKIKRGDALRFADTDLDWSVVPMPEDNSMCTAVYGIGSSEYNDIRLQMGTVSRFHATVKVGKDGKVYIVDHSTNGTTVNGTRIASNTPREIKKTDTVLCGGATLDLTGIKWPALAVGTTLPLKKIGIAVAAIVLLAIVVFGVTKLAGGKKEYTDAELFAKYSNASVMLVGVYHYELTVGDYDIDAINADIASKGVRYSLPKKLFWTGEKELDISKLSQKDLLDLFDNEGAYSGTGFFISEDAQIITNLHVVKPWLYNGVDKQLKDKYMTQFAKVAEVLNSYYITSYTALVAQLDVKGVLDYIALVPNGEVFDPDNIIKCRVLSAGNDPDVDVALIQTVSSRMPSPKCTYVNLKDSMDVADESLIVGERVYTIGFPAGMTFQQSGNTDKGIMAIGQGGNIIQQDAEFDFAYNAPTTGGASGSPVYNKYGMLIGVHHAGHSNSNVKTQGYNYGIKAKYVKDLIEKPHKVN